MSAEPFQPKPEHKFSFGLWTVGNRGRDPFGDFVRPPISPVEIAAMLGEVGAWGVNFHDNDLVPMDATPSDRDAIVRDFKRACKENGLVVPMATVSLFFHPVFRDGAFTANDPEVRAYALQKPCARWTSEQSSVPKRSSSGAAEKVSKPMHAAARTKPSSVSAKQ